MSGVPEAPGAARGPVEEPPELLDRGDGVRLALRRLPGRAPTLAFLPGLRSHMGGEKALALAALCRRRGQAMLRLDYAGHGASDGRFVDGTVGEWLGDALFALDQVEGPLVLVGSSLGGWIALLAALRLGARVRALVGVAAAPDFTEDLMWAAMAPSERATLLRDGVLHVPNAYGDPMPVTRRLVEEGRQHLLLRDAVALRCPVRLLHGQADRDVPWETALRLAARIESADVQVTLVKDGGHRLSRPQDLAVLERLVGEVLEG